MFQVFKVGAVDKPSHQVLWMEHDAKDLGAVVQDVRAMLALGSHKHGAIIVNDGRGVAMLSVNEWKAAPHCTPEEKEELEREFVADNFLGYTWLGLDARAGLEHTGEDFTDEDVLALAEEARGVDYLMDERDFEDLARDYVTRQNRDR